MSVLVLDSFGSFSLVPYLKKKYGEELYSMNDLSTPTMMDVFCRVNPGVVFVDFANENAVNLTNKFSSNQKRPSIVIRLHGYEAQSWFMNSIKWECVDHLIVVSPKFKEIVRSKIGDAVKISVVPNGIDLDKFKLQDDSKVDDSSVAYAGYFNKKKGPTLLRTFIMSSPHLKFHLAGAHQDEQVRLYLEDKPMPNATFYGWVDTSEFLKGKRYILSTSVTESFGMSIAEGMAMGLTPMVHHWPGADKIWPAECLWSTIDDAMRIQIMEPVKCRKWIEDRYSMDACIESVVNLLEG